MKFLARILAVLLVLCMVVRPATAAAEYEEHVYAVTINGESVSTGTIVLQAADGSLLVAGDDLARWRILLTSKTPRTAFDGRPYFALNDFPGLVTKVDETRQVLVIQAPGDLFSANTIDSSLVNAAGRVINRDRGAFLNYDIFSSRIGSTALTDGLLEGGISSAHGGVLTSSVGMAAGLRRRAFYQTQYHVAARLRERAPHRAHRRRGLLARPARRLREFCRDSVFERLLDGPGISNVAGARYSRHRSNIVDR